MVGEHAGTTGVVVGNDAQHVDFGRGKNEVAATIIIRWELSPAVVGAGHAFGTARIRPCVAQGTGPFPCLEHEGIAIAKWATIVY